MEPRHIHTLEQLRALLLDLSETTAKATALYYATLVANDVPSDDATLMAIERARELDERVLGPLLDGKRG